MTPDPAPGDPAPPQMRADRPAAFVSYSRRDRQFVQRLTELLAAHGKSVWVDWDDIPPSAPWSAAVDAGIERSEAFVFVITPDALDSPECSHELAHAVELGKKLVPILLREVGDRPVPPALAEPNWITVGDDDRTVHDVIAALETDLHWARAHTQIIVRANEWDGAARDGSFLLRGVELRTAEAAVAQHADGGGPPQPTALQQRYLLESRTSETSRQRRRLLITAVVAIVACALAVLAGWQWRRADTQAQVAFSRELAASSSATLTTDPQLGVLLADEATRRHATAEATRALRGALVASHLQRRLPHRGPVWAAAVSPNRRIVVTASADGKARMWSVKTGRLLATLPHYGFVSNVSFSPGGEEVVTTGDNGPAQLWPLFLQRGGRDPTARVWAVPSGARIKTLRVNNTGVNAATFSPDGRRLVTAGEDGAAVVWDTSAWRPVRRIRQGGRIVSVTFNRDGSRVLTVAWRGPTLVWNPRDGRIVARLRTGTGYEGVFTPDGRRVVIAQGSQGAVLWDASTGRRLSRFSARGAFVYSVALSHRGDRLVTAGLGGAWLWRVHGGRLIRRLEEDVEPVRDAEFSPDDSAVVTGGDDGSVRLWSATSGRLQAVGAGHTENVWTTSWVDNRHVISGSDDRSAVIWDFSQARPTGHPLGRGGSWSIVPAAAGNVRLAVLTDRTLSEFTLGMKRSFRFPGPARRVKAGANLAALSPDGRLAALAVARRVTIVEVATGRVVAALKGVVGDRAAVDGDLATFDTRSARFAVADSRQVNLWSRAAGGVTRVLRSSALNAYEEYEAVALSPDGTRTAATTTNGKLVLWGVRNEPERILTASLDGSGAPALAFSRDGRAVATGDLEGKVRVWDVATGDLVAEVAHVADSGSNIAELAFDPLDSTDRSLLTVNEDGEARLWDLEAGDAVTVLQEGTGSFLRLAFARGRALIAVERAGALNVYTCYVCESLNGLRALAQREVGRRQLTPTERFRYLHERRPSRKPLHPQVSQIGVHHRRLVPSKR